MAGTESVQLVLSSLIACARGKAFRVGFILFLLPPYHIKLDCSILYGRIFSTPEKQQ